MSLKKTYQTILDSKALNEKLKRKILRELRKSGFSIRNNKLEHKQTKEDIRKLHNHAVENLRIKYNSTLKRKERNLLDFVANGDEVNPKKIKPKLMYVNSDSQHWDLFNYIKIHWSVPISSGYGKRLCYIVFDESNCKVIGIIGLQDPVLGIPKRDEFIGWSRNQKNKNMNMVMDGFVIGAIPPYNMMLGGKLVASLLFSNQVRENFRNKYKGTKSFILKRENPGELVLITTLSALGKSAMYDRISLPNGQKYISVGYSVGYGEFHFNGSIYKNMRELVLLNKPPSYKHKEWGTGFRNKREVVLKSLSILGLQKKLIMHGVKREMFLIPLASNFKQVLIENAKPNYYNISVNDITEYMKERWIIPRTEKNQDYKKWDKKDYLLWN